MGRKKIVIPQKILYTLYHVQGHSPARIGKRYNCNAVTVRTRIKEYGIPKKTPSLARMRYKKYDFTGSNKEKAYMIGFRLGDLNVYLPSHRSETIVVRCHSTHDAQIRLIQKLFSQYGRVSVSIAKNQKNRNVNCYLNQSFSFLLPKYNAHISSWIRKAPSRMIAFTAGYIDAEGTFGINQGKGRFKIDSYDQAILKDIYDFLLKKRFVVKFRRLVKKGESKYGTTWNNDLWRLEINEALSLEKFVVMVEPYLQHMKRKDDAHMVATNIKKRKENGTITSD